MDGVNYLRLYTDQHGETHFEDVPVAMAERTFAPPAPPQQLSAFWAATRFAYVSMPAGWYGDWHPTPARQVFFILQGSVDVRVSDGERRTLTPGVAILVEDTAGRGHITSTLSGVTMAVVQLE